MIISRYIKREIFATLLALTILLLAIFISEQFISYMRSAAIGRLNANTVMLLVVLQIPVLLTFLLPLSLYLGIIVSVSRFYADSEMAVISASGVSPSYLFRIILNFVVGVVLILSILSLFIAPKMEEYSTRIFQQDESSILQLLKPGRFSNIATDKWIFYISDTSKESGQLVNVFASEEPDPQDIKNRNSSWGVLFADRGYIKKDQSGQQFLVLTPGHRYNGMPGRKNYRLVAFKEYGIRLDQKKVSSRFKENSLPTATLLRNLDKKDDAAEFHWRLASPIMAFILAFLALPISQVRPRRGRFAKIVPAILLYIIYVNLLFLGRAWLSKGSASIGLGYWWVHAIMVGFTVVLIYYGFIYRPGKTIGN